MTIEIFNQILQEVFGRLLLCAGAIIFGYLIGNLIRNKGRCIKI